MAESGAHGASQRPSQGFRSDHDPEDSDIYRDLASKDSARTLGARDNLEHDPYHTNHESFASNTSINQHDLSDHDESLMHHRLPDADSSFYPAASPSATHSEELPEHQTSSYDEQSSLDRVSRLEGFSSSPTAAAAARTVSRALSHHQSEGVSGPGPGPHPDAPSSPITANDDGNARDEVPERTPTKSNGIRQPMEEDNETTPQKPYRRPQYLSHRLASQRSSKSSWTSQGDNNLDLDFGQDRLDQHSRSQRDSLRSLQSDVSNPNPIPQHRSVSTAVDELDALQEESTSGFDGTPRGPATPAARQIATGTPTDTVINQRVHNLRVPGTVARRFLSQESQVSVPPTPMDQARPVAGVRSKNMTLKEQDSTIDKLQKEVWQLKLKIYYLEQTLDERSEESVKVMISENVDLQAYKFSAKKEIRALKRQIMELTHKLKEKEASVTASPNVGANQSPKGRDLSLELTAMQERSAQQAAEIAKLRREAADREAEKRRLISSTRSNGASDIGTREEIAMWKDLLEAETARKEEADEEIRKLRESLWRLKAAGADDESRTGGVNGVQSFDGNVVSRHERSEDTNSSLTLVEQLRHENADLRREVGAQASMLTSRNREKERLYQEIEDLKMANRRTDVKSIAGDSIFERSASRAIGRPSSRNSSQYKAPLTEAEREMYEATNGELRDSLAQMRMQHQDLLTQMNTLLDENEALADSKLQLDKLQLAFDELTDQTTQELLTLQQERDEALQLQEDSEMSLQDLRQEAQGQINNLEDELAELEVVLEQTDTELLQKVSELEALQNEVRMLKDGLTQVEVDAQARLRKIKELELENTDITKEMETTEQSLLEANSKVEKLSIELESRVSECAFLREEQDSWVLKKGDLETSIKAAQTALDAERDKAKDLDARLTEERYQREVVGSKEKQEVQKIINDLNRDITAAKEEMRTLKTLAEGRENEMKTWKERYLTFEADLRELLGTESSSRGTMLNAVVQLHRDYEAAEDDLSQAKRDLGAKDQQLIKRDMLLETQSLETKRISDMLDKERSAHRALIAKKDQWSSQQQIASLSVGQKDARIQELQAERRRGTSSEALLKQAVLERNQQLLSLWHRLAALCGTEWQQEYSLVNGHLPTIEVVNTMMQAFSKNLMLAVSKIESIMSRFRSQIKSVERELAKDYQHLDHQLDIRIKRIERLESTIHARAIEAPSPSQDVTHLKDENVALKAALSSMRKAATTAPRTSSSAEVKAPSRLENRRPDEKIVSRRDSEQDPSTVTSAADREKYLQYRLSEYERRLRSEREGRLLDRDGAMKRLLETKAENESLKKELERSKNKTE